MDAQAMERGREGRKEKGGGGTDAESRWRIYEPVPLFSLLAVTGPQSGIGGSGAPQPRDQSNGNSAAL